VHDLAIITVSTNAAHWLGPCLSSVFDHLGDLDADVVVVDNGSGDGTADVAGEFPAARVVRSPNHGFAHANNRALTTCDARYVVFLNPDTEILDGTFAGLVGMMDERPTVGLAGVRQLNPEGGLDATIRRSPNALRALGEALGAERLPVHPRWLGERELDPASYDRERRCDWTTGSFMLVRREALGSAGRLDERYFMYSEETDFCRRISMAGWDIRHLPQMTILHHSTKGGVDPIAESLNAHTSMLYARKFISPAHRLAYTGAVMLRHGLRSACGGPPSRAAGRRALATLLGRAPVPYAAITSNVSLLPTASERRDTAADRDADGVVL
jgi:GT2 family glycosyltransferase